MILNNDFMIPLPGLDKLHTQRRVCTQRARKEIFACTKLCARKSIKTLNKYSYVIEGSKLFLCLKANNIWHNKIWHS